jgi:hypothetical protein
MPRVLPVSLATGSGGCPACPFQHHFWSAKRSDGSMLTRLKNWVRGSRQRKRERWADEYGTLSAQDRHVVDSHKEAHGTWEEETGPYSTKIFDEQSRGRPGN